MELEECHQIGALYAPRQMRSASTMEQSTQSKMLVLDFEGQKGNQILVKNILK